MSLLVDDLLLLARLDQGRPLERVEPVDLGRVVADAVEAMPDRATPASPITLEASTVLVRPGDAGPAAPDRGQPAAQRRGAHARRAPRST